MQKPWYIYLISLFFILISAIFIISNIFGIIGDVRNFLEFAVSVPYFGVITRVIIILFFAYLIMTALYLFNFKEISIKLLYIAIVIFAIILVAVKIPFIIPIELIAGGALVEFLKRAKYKGKKLLN